MSATTLVTLFTGARALGLELSAACHIVFQSFETTIVPIIAGNRNKDNNATFQAILETVDDAVGRTSRPRPLTALSNLRLLGTLDQDTGRVMFAAAQLEIESTPDPFDNDHQSRAILRIAGALRVAMCESSARGDAADVHPLDRCVPLEPNGRPINSSEMNPDTVEMYVETLIRECHDLQSRPTATVWISISLDSLTDHWAASRAAALYHNPAGKPGTNLTLEEYLATTHPNPLTIGPNPSGITISGINIADLVYSRQAVEKIGKAFEYIVPSDGQSSKGTLHCVNPKHDDRSPSMVLFMSGEMWKKSRISRKITDDENKRLEQEASDPIRYGVEEKGIVDTKREKSYGYNCVRGQDGSVVILYLVRGFCRSCRWTGVLTRQQLE